MNSLASSETSCGNEGSVGCVAILNKAAIGSSSHHGGLVVNISTTVQPRLLQMAHKQRQKENSPKYSGYISDKFSFPPRVFVISSCFLLIVLSEFVLTWKRENRNAS